MSEPFILKLIDKISFFYGFFGLDYKEIRKILKVKLIMDERRTSNISNVESKNGKTNLFKKSLIVYAFIGFFVGITMLSPIPLFIKGNIIFGLSFFMIMSVLISDYSSVLLDVKEKSILGSRPLNPKSINAAKMSHIAIYIFQIGMAIMGPALLMGSYKHGALFGVAFVLASILLIAMTVFLSSLMYFLLLKFFSGEKLKDILNYFQIFISIFIMIFYQVMVRIFEISELTATFSQGTWTHLIPSAWFSSFLILATEGFEDTYYIVSASLGLIIPVILFTVYSKGIVPYFEANLQKIFESSSNERYKKKRVGLLERILSRDPRERAFISLSKNIMAKDRKLKLKLYPGLSFAVIFPFIFLLNLASGLSFDEFRETLLSGRYYMYCYFSIMFIVSLLPLISTSENYKAAWIYKAMPLDNPQIIFKGAVKAFIIKYVIPVQAFICILFLIIYNMTIPFDMILLLINSILAIVLAFKFSEKRLPFSEDFEYLKNNNMAMLFTSAPIYGGLALIHFISGNFTYGIFVAILVSLAALLVTWKKGFKVEWKGL